VNLPSIEHRLSPPSAPDRVHPTVSRALDQYPASLAWHEPAHRSSPRSAADGRHLTKSSPRRITRRRMRAASVIIVSLPSRAPIDDCQGSSDEIFAPKSCLFRRVPTTAWAINSTDTTRNTCQRTAHHCHRDWFQMRAERVPPLWSTARGPGPPRRDGCPPPSPPACRWKAPVVFRVLYAVDSLRVAALGTTRTCPNRATASSPRTTSP
jgi:hypothetical protein